MNSLAPHGARGTILYDYDAEGAGERDSSNPDADGAYSADIGADGGNVGLLGGSVRWKSIDQMQKYRGSQLWGEDGAFTVW